MFKKVLVSLSVASLFALVGCNPTENQKPVTPDQVEQIAPDQRGGDAGHAVDGKKDDAKKDDTKTSKQPVKRDAAEVKKVSESLRAAREKHLAMLHDYWTAGQFPHNDTGAVANIFRDGDGDLCAVANMIWKDGSTKLVDDTVSDNNYIRLADVNDGPLHDWVLSSGFTQEEVAMIQAPYIPEPQSNYEFFRQQETARLQERLSSTEDRLRDDTDLSIKVATDRFLDAGVHAEAIAAR